ncbi:MAG: HDIG domain-containing metalloprotein [bacterium]
MASFWKKIFEKREPKVRKESEHFRPARLVGRGLVVVVVYLLLVYIVSPSFYVESYRVEKGRTVEESIRAPITFAAIDILETARRREEAENHSARVFTYDSQVLADSLNRLDDILKAARKVRADLGDQSRDEQHKALDQALEKDLRIKMSSANLKTLLDVANSQKFEESLKALFKKIYTSRGLTEHKTIYITSVDKSILDLKEKNKKPFDAFENENILSYPDEVSAFLKMALPQYFRDQATHDLAFELADDLLKPNVIYEPKLTARAREQMLAQIEPTEMVFEKGSVVIPAGTMVGDREIEYIDALNTQVQKIYLFNLLSSAAFVFFLSLSVVFYLKKFKSELPLRTANIFLIALPLLLTLAIGRVTLETFPHRDWAGFFFPIGVVAMLGVILIDARFAFLLVICGALMFGLATEFEPKYLIVAIFGGMTAVTSLYSIKERKEVLMAGMKTSLVNFLAIGLLYLIETPENPQWLLGAWGIGNGIFCSMVTYYCLPLFEILFGVTTDVRLLELTGIHHPLLREFEQKAPGSYQHVLNVSKLAESAAAAIGANYLLVRAGGYYHDVGKMVKPKYFSENQVTPEDRKVHSKLSPHMSTLIIKNHVKEGIELARKHKLPQQVIDFIPQHQGTGLIRYFYHKAQEEALNSDSPITVREEDFRYPGPKPQSIEAGVVLLADSVEATATSVFVGGQVSEDSLRHCVHKTIVEKFNDGQFDECNLTLRDLHLIQESFVKILLARFHFRVAYPGTSRPGPPPAPEKSAAPSSRQAPELASAGKD